MKILTKKKAGSQQITKLQQRISGIGTPELILWAENALYSIGKELTHFQRDKPQLILEEARMGAEALLAITEELIKRSEK